MELTKRQLEAVQHLLDTAGTLAGISNFNNRISVRQAIAAVRDLIPEVNTYPVNA